MFRIKDLFRFRLILSASRATSMSKIKRFLEPVCIPFGSSLSVFLACFALWPLSNVHLR